jgi:hypothetical protein
MADKLLGTYFITASIAGAEIPLPATDVSGSFATGYQLSMLGTNVIYQFSSLHSGSIELVQTVGETAGLEIESATAVTSGPWRLIAKPPKFLYSAKDGGEPCRVTVIIIR